MPEQGLLLVVVGCWLLVVGCRLLVVGCCWLLLVVGCWFPGVPSGGDIQNRRGSRIPPCIAFGRLPAASVDCLA